MKLLVIGAGSLGLLLAGRLVESRTGTTALMTRTEQQARRLRAEGLHMEEEASVNKKELEVLSFENVARLASGADRCQTEGWDGILLTVKQTHLTPELLHFLAKIVRVDTLLVCFQNGIGHVETLVRYGVPSENIALAVTTEGALQVAPNRVRHTGRGTTWIGPEGAQLVNTLNEVGWPTEYALDIHLKVWEKLVINAVINPLTAFHRIRNGELLDNAEYLHTMKKLFEEAVMVAAASGITLPADLWERLLTVCRNTAANQSSMLQDVLAGRPTEIEAITGSLLRLAAKHRITLPAHELLFHRISLLYDQNNQNYD